MKRIVTGFVCLAMVVLLLLGIAGCTTEGEADSSGEPASISSSADHSPDAASADAVSASDPASESSEAFSDSVTSEQTEESAESGSNEPSQPTVEGTAVTMFDFTHEWEYLGLQRDVYGFVSACIRADREQALEYMLGNNALPESFPTEARKPNDLNSYAYTAMSFQPYELDGVQTQQADITIRYAFKGNGSGFRLQMRLVCTGREGSYVFPRWKVTECTLTAVPADDFIGLSFEATENAPALPVTLEAFCGDDRYVCLQNTAFRFFVAYLNSDLETAREIVTEEFESRGDFPAQKPLDDLDEQDFVYYIFGETEENAYATIGYYMEEDEGLWYMILAFDCVDDGAGGKTWKVSGYDFGA